MTMQGAVRRGARWMPITIAVVILASMLISRQINDFQAAVATLLVLAGLAASVRLPRIALGTALSGALLASGTDPYYSWWLLVIACVTVSIATFGVEPLLIRLLSGIPVAIAGGIAVSIHAQTLRNSYAYSSWDPTPNAFGTWLSAMLVWGAAVGVRALHDALRAESAKQQAVARTTVVESELRDERLRADLTHDFHDVMAHSLAVLAAQAEGLRLTFEARPERIGPVLTTISDTARLALVEVRQLLERVDDDARRPQPTSADIPELVAQMRSAGPEVRLQDVGTHGHLARGADMAAYRIVQESLTNALRHGGTDIDITVALAWTGPGLSLAVTSPIRDRVGLRPAGRGIAGMHERARVAGGSLEIDTEGDRFVVSAYLPYAVEPEGTAVSGRAGDTDEARPGLRIGREPTQPLTEDQLSTLPMPTQRPAPRPEDAAAPWSAARWSSGRESDGWARATTVDLTPDSLPGGRIRNPAADPEQA